MVIATPARIGAFGNVDQAFFLTLKICIVIDRKQVSVVVKIEGLAVAQAAGKNFEISSIRIASQDRSGVGVSEALAFARDHISPSIAHAPVDLAVEPLHQAVQIVIAVADMVGEAVDENLLLVRGDRPRWCRSVSKRPV